MWLFPPEMANGIDAKGGVEHEEGPSYSRQQETSQSAHPPVVEKAHDKGQSQPGDHDGYIVTILPEDQGILAQARAVFPVAILIFKKDPAAVRIPKTPLRVIGIIVLVAARVMPDVSAGPFQRRVFQGPPACNQQGRFHPW